MENLSIGQLAESTKVNIQTIRYYERQGILPEPKRRESGYRVYSDADVQRIQFIRRAKELGFSLREIIDLLRLRVDEDTTCEEVKHQAQEKIRDVEEKIGSLKRIKKALTELAATCTGQGPGSECPILEFLNRRERT